MKDEVFLDTGYVIALAVPRDLLHERAVDLAAQIEATGTRIVTTRAVTLEIGNALSRQRHRHAAAQLLNALETDPRVEIVPLSEQLFSWAFHLYCERHDKEWGLTDCISFIVMWERGITDALTADRHFQQAGFRALLREGSL